MKLITESTQDVELLTEGAGPEKNYFIKGVFAQSEIQNRNGRSYPRSIMEREVSRYNTNYVSQKRALGELSHPESPAINPDRVSHIIQELYPDGNNIMGKAKVMDTTCGRTVKNFIDEGVKIGVSTRGVGSLKEGSGGIQIVQPDFHLATVDIVLDPSGPDCYVQGIYEGKEWIFDEKNGWVSGRVAESHRKIVKRNRIDETMAMTMFNQFMNSLKG